MTQLIQTGKTVAEATQLACEKLGVPQERVTVEVLEEEKKGLFGFGKADARVRVSYEERKDEAAVAYLKMMLQGIGAVGAEIRCTCNEEENSCLLDIVVPEEHMGVVIGRHGETLDSMQYLTSLACNRSDEAYYRVVLDCNNYREKRKKALEELAVKITKTVLRTGRPVTLEPMNPYERRIIHAKVSEFEDTESKSVGVEPNRCVVIRSTKPRPEAKKGGGRRDRRPREQKPVDFRTSFEKDYKKPKPEDSIGGELYGKIEIE